jgi:hypothetical protein
MQIMKGLVPISIAIIFSAWTADRGFASDAAVEPQTEAAVLAADDDWLAAELRGDLKALDARLMPTYRDVTPEGKIHTKQDLLAGVAKHPDKVTTAPLQAAADYREQHPAIEHVLIEGDTALLQFESRKPEEQGSRFSFHDGTFCLSWWHATIRSTNAEEPLFMLNSGCALGVSSAIRVLRHTPAFCRHRGTTRTTMLSSWQEAVSASEQTECSRGRFSFRSNRAS